LIYLPLLLWINELQLQRSDLSLPGREARICMGCPVTVPLGVPPGEPRL
jgi:hypothetical protein